MAESNSKFHYAFIIAIGVAFMQMGGLGCIMDANGVFFTYVCDDLGITRAEMASYLTFYFITTIFAMPIVGSWIQKYNIRIVLSVAMILTAGCVFAMGFYNAPWQWWISGIILGSAGSFIFVVPGPILIQNWFIKRRGIVMGITMAFSGIGGALFSPIFTAIIEAVGWRMGYHIAGIIDLALVLPWTLFVFRLHPEDKGLRPYGWTAEQEALEKERELEKKSGPGVAHKRALKSVSFWMMFLFAGFVAFFAGFNSHLPGYAQSIGYTAMVASTLLTAVMVGNIVEKLLVGWLNDKIGVEFTVNIQLAMIICGLAGFIFLAGKGLVFLYLSAFLFGAQNSTYSVSNPLIVRQLFGERDYPKIFTYTRIGTGVIGCFGPTIIGLVYDVTGAFQWAFALGIGVALASFIVCRFAYANRKKLHWEGLTAEEENRLIAEGKMAAE